MTRFLIIVVTLTLGLPPLVNLAVREKLLASSPSFLYETTWLVAITTTVIFVYLYRSDRPSFFVQLYLLSMVVKLIAFLSYSLLMVLDDRSGAVLNVLYFLAVYILLTAVEISFLYRRISGSPKP